ncbi:ATP-binding cassette domain-containing protein, partial [Brevibacterium aurantiacum]
MSGSDRMMKTLDGADGAIETPGSARTVDGGQPILDVDHLDVTFSTDAGDVHAVKDVSLAVRPGEVLAIVGESGSGKTVTARSILVVLPETDVLAVSAEELREMRGSDVAMVFQEPSTALNPVFTVGWQIAEGLRAHHRKASRAELKAKVVAAMEQVGIPDAEHRFD